MLNVDSLTDTRICIDDKWVVARPMHMSGFDGLIRRVKDAYMVIVGKADAIKFYKQ